MIGDHESPVPRTPIRRILYPLERFLRIEASGGILLLAATVAALVWANVPHGAESYAHVWHTPGGFSIGGFTLSMSLSHWINDSLMGVFFFVVGLEIKREILVGELKQPRQAALPIAAAFGGMVVPALIYFLFNSRGIASEGWGIPMATDIAFAVGVMALLGSRAPLSLKIFITALAIVDDLGAVLVIALFYTGSLNFQALVLAAFLLLLMFVLNWIGVRAAGVYLIVGFALWLALLDSGMHATLAGVLAALAIPARRHINGRDFLAHSRHYLGKFESSGVRDELVIPDTEQQNAMEGMETVLEAAQSPMARLEHVLHPWVMYAIMPLFALSNAGVTLIRGEGAALQVSLMQMFREPVTLGVMAGLFIGKPVGILAACWITIRTGLGVKPRGVGWVGLLGAGSLAGIGFTMSLFIANLALDSEPYLTEAKLGFLAASLLSGIVGSVILLLAPRSEHAAAVAP